MTRKVIGIRRRGFACRNCLATSGFTARVFEKAGQLRDARGWRKSVAQRNRDSQ
jgi:hypothetical protein